MNPPACQIHALLADTNSDDQFNQATINRLAPEVSDIISKSGAHVSKALFIYYASAETDCENKLKANIQKLFQGGITVECIIPGSEGEMIDNAECIVIGGGDLKKLKDALVLYGANIWKKVLAGTPFVGINAGAVYLSSVNINIPSNTCLQISYFPIQFKPGYNDTPQQQTEVRDLLNHNPLLKYVLAMPTINEGGGITMEDAKSGLAGTNTDSGGSNPPPGVVQELYIYVRDGAGGIKQVQWTGSQRKNLPINIM